MVTQRVSFVTQCISFMTRRVSFMTQRVTNIITYYSSTKASILFKKIKIKKQAYYSLKKLFIKILLQSQKVQANA